MQQFAELFNRLEQTKSTSEKVLHIKSYFQSAAPGDAAWALFFLSGNTIKRLITARMLFDWCMENLSFPDWLMMESYSAVGDVAETIALLMQNKGKRHSSNTLSLSEWIEKRILPLRGQSEEIMKERIFAYWNELSAQEILVLNKILSGSMRIGVSHLLTIQGLSRALNVPKEKLSQRLMGNWTPSKEFFEGLKEENISSQINLNPYPFYLASPLENKLEELGNTVEWDAEWKWDGIRAQCIRRGKDVAIWSRGNELITHQFPEISEALLKIEDSTVLDGEILAFKGGKPLPFGELQKRLGRKKVSESMIREVPIVFMIYDILEYQGSDIRKLPFIERRAIFENWQTIDPRIVISPKILFQSWNELKSRREEAKTNGTEGVILKRKASSYGVGRRRGDWWKYKIDPKTIDAVLIYAQRGQGWRANLYTDYTFGIWKGDELVPIAKAYSGLTQDEILELDRWIRKNTEEKFGPVKKVKVEQVFEIAFEGIQESKRHKSGVALRFPRIHRWRKDKLAAECDSLESIRKEFFSAP
jgi:DNA ligase 1